MSFINVRRGKYGVYNGKLYRILSKSISLKSDIIEICSTDEQDLENGFMNNDSEFFTKKYGFTCTKEIHKSEITEVYEIVTHAIYKGLTCGIIGGRNGTNLLTLAAPYEFPHNPTGEMLEIRNNLVEMGFHDAIHEKTFCMYIIEVDMDDPELELVEEITESDISKL
ncbi:MAG: hypothetical protein K2K34_07850 [Oscillospiraceae bacterium]|nr:hypothetical protein [Oscillospiraceae bacterium]